MNYERLHVCRLFHNFYYGDALIIFYIFYTIICDIVDFITRIRKIVPKRSSKLLNNANSMIMKINSPLDPGIRDHINKISYQDKWWPRIRWMPPPSIWAIIASMPSLLNIKIIRLIKLPLYTIMWQLGNINTLKLSDLLLKCSFYLPLTFLLRSLCQTSHEGRHV